MGNAVGSLEIPIKLNARKNLSLLLTERQREILIGCILGDAHIRELGKVRIEQSSKQKEYIDWKYRELESLAYPAFPKSVIRIHSANGKTYRSFYFDLRQYFRPFREIFYKEKKKVFPRYLQLTPLSLAVWYMDDGCWTGAKYILSTDCFDLESGQNLQCALYQQFQIETLRNKDGKLLIRKKSHETFYRLVSPYVIPSMRYKFPNPVTTFWHKS